MTTQPHPIDQVPPGGRWRPAVVRLVSALLVALGLAAGLEAFVRLVLVPASRDFRSFVGYPARAAELDATAGLRVAVFGNSTARSGVDGEELGALMGETLGRPVAARLFVADSAEVSTWHFMMRRYLWRPGLRADLTVLLFYGDGLSDSRVPEIGRLAQFFTTPQDVGDVFRFHLPEIGQRLEYLLSSCWMTYAARDRLREGMLKALVPGHAACEQRLNDWLFAGRAADTATEPSYTRLARLLGEAHASGTRVVVVALPTAPSRAYEVPDALVRTVEEAGMTFLDDRSAPGITPDLFPDGLHLADPGKAIYTRLLAAELSRLVSGEPRPRAGGAE